MPRVVEKNWKSDGFSYTIFKEGILHTAAPHSGQPIEARTAEKIRTAVYSYCRRNSGTL